MKNLILSLSLLFSISFYAQTEQKTNSGFSFGGHFGLGTSSLNSENFKNLDGTYGEAGIDINYDFSKNTNEFLSWRLGLGFYGGSYSSNLFINNEQSNLRVELIKVPLFINMVLRIPSDQRGELSKAKIIFGAGGFMNYLYNTEINTVVVTEEIKDIDNVSFGLATRIVFEYDINQRYAVNLGIESNIMGDKNERDKLNFNNYFILIGTSFKL